MIGNMCEGYSEGADEKHGAQEAADDGQPLCGPQLTTEHLHAGEYQHRQEAGQHQRRACVHCYNTA